MDRVVIRGELFGRCGGLYYSLDISTIRVDTTARDVKAAEPGECSMKYTRRRRHLRPTYTRSQIHSSIRQFELALEVLRVEATYELKRPAPSAERLRWMQERANFCLDQLAKWEGRR
jgi:hypothetical protein